MSRSRTAARRRLAVLAAGQVLLAVAGAAAPSLHLGSASHHHVFCPEHARFEDVPRAGDAARAPVTTLAVAHGSAATHTACAFSNLLLRPMHLGPGERLAVLGSAQSVEPVANVQAGHLAVAALDLAPKQSPPARAATISS
ncbi:MAG: hypothetical protein QM765_18325 [Myxococcales bacterium]